jgi:hypothetical protein
MLDIRKRVKEAHGRSSQNPGVNTPILNAMEGEDDETKQDYS